MYLYYDEAVRVGLKVYQTHLKLPLPVDVGNSLYRYLCVGRPQSNSHHVFVHHRAPYCRFENATFGRLLNAALTAQCVSESIRGFHVTRKTFASKLLAAGNLVTTIAAALGHVGVDTVDEYLATNEDQMRLCAIGLEGIEYSGGFGQGDKGYFYLPYGYFNGYVTDMWTGK